MTSEVTRENQTRWRLTALAKAVATAKANKGKGKGHVRGKVGHFARDCWSRAPQDKNSRRSGRCQGGCRRSKEFVFTIENAVEDVCLSQSVCESHEDGLVMIDSGASVNVCSMWFGESAPEKSDLSVRLQGADGRTLQDYGQRQIWLRIGNHLKTI